MDFTELYKSLDRYRQKNSLPASNFYPSSFALPKVITENLVKMKTWTDDDGTEYEVSVFDINGMLVITPLFKGSKRNVKASHNVKVKYIPNKHGYYREEIIVDNKNYSQKDKKKIVSNNISFVMSFHTHPPYTGSKDVSTYGFFSDTDLLTLIGSDNMMLGLVTDSVWIACQTDRTVKKIGEVGIQLLNAISQRTYRDESSMVEIVKNEMSKWGIVFYNGKIGSLLRRLN